MKNNVFQLFFLVVVFSTVSCMHTALVPFAISEPECRIGKEEKLYDFAGIHFVFYNNTDKNVDSFKCSFIVFDSTGEDNPFIGSNIIVAQYEQTIEAQESHDIVISLDSYISQIPTEEFIVDFFYVEKIEYDDGSIWQDPYAAWLPGGL